MSEDYEIANETCAQNRTRGKQYYDRRVRSSELRPGDRVLVRNLSKRETLFRLTKGLQFKQNRILMTN